MSAAGRLEAALARIAVTNADWHIVTALDTEGAAEAAAASDARHARGAARGPLDGVLVGVKDNLAVRGLPWTCGIAGWRDRIAEQDSVAVARLRAAGAVILGTLNMHEGALGATTDNPTFGQCANPLDPGRTPGGSSGGSGAAVAAGYVELALGTDTMGSVRIPAAYCGCYGLKPTDGIVPRDGLALLSPSLDCIGPLAADPALLAAAHSVLADAPGKLARPAIQRPRIGLPRQIGDVACEAAVLDALETARKALADLGDVTEIDLTGWDPGRARRGGLLLTEAEGAVECDDLLRVEGALSSSFRALLDYGRNASGERLVVALARMRAAREAAMAGLREVDLLLLPTAPQRAFPHGDEAPANQADFTSLANFAGLPAISIPVPTGETLPAAIQLIGPPHSEPTLLALAANLRF